MCGHAKKTSLIDDTIDASATTRGIEGPWSGLHSLAADVASRCAAGPQLVWGIADRRGVRLAIRFARLIAERLPDLPDAECSVIRARQYDAGLRGPDLARLECDVKLLSDAYAPADITGHPMHPGQLSLTAGSVTVVLDTGRWGVDDLLSIAAKAQRKRYRAAGTWVTPPRATIIASLACACGGDDVVERPAVEPRERCELARHAAGELACECGVQDHAAWERRATALSWSLPPARSLRTGRGCSPAVTSDGY